MVRRDNLNTEDIPELPGYLSVGKAAERHGVNKGTIYYHIFTSRKLKTVFKITRGGDDPRPILLVAEREVDAVFASRTVRADSTPTNVELRDWNRRVKQWAGEVGWTETVVRESGPPPRSLVAAYALAHPDDIEPAS
jgi:hypothetical protein